MAINSSKIIDNLLIPFRFFFIIIVSIICVILIMMIFLYTIVFNMKYIENIIEKTNYYENIKDTVYEKVSMYVYQSGFDESVLDNVCSTEIIKKDTDIILSNFFENQDDSLVYAEYIKNTIEENIKNNKEFSKVSDQSKDEFIKCIQNEYKNTVIFDFITNKFSIEDVRNIFYKALKFLIFSLVVGNAVVDLVSRNNGKLSKKEFIKSLCYIMYITSIIGFSLIYVIRKNIDINNISVFGNEISNIIRYLLNNLTHIYIYINIGILVLTIFINMLNFKPKQNIEK